MITEPTSISVEDINCNEKINTLLISLGVVKQNVQKANRRMSISFMYYF